jgi:hypothetical protein
MSKKHMLLLLTIVLGWLSNTIYCQVHVDTSKWHYDFEVDYYPNIKNCHVSKGIGFTDDNGSAFKESLEHSLKACTGKEYSLVRFSGFYMSSAGMEPKHMKENPSIYLNIYASGSIHTITIQNFDNIEEIENCLKAILNNCQIKPALKNGKAVKSSWSFTIHRK